MTKGQKMRKAFGPQPVTGPSQCLRTEHVFGPCSKCGAPMEPAHSPLHLSGLFCNSCPCCTAPAGASVALSATTRLPEARGAAKASAGARGGAFNRKPWGREYSRYLEG
jgi:hypothetical protein